MDIDLTIVVPCLDDWKETAQLVMNIASIDDLSSYSIQIIVVDDGSSTCGLDYLRNTLRSSLKGRKLLQVILCQLTRNMGQQSAIYVGSCYAEGSYIMYIDGDGQFDERTVKALWSHRHDAELISGVRTGRYHIFSKVGNVLLRWLLGVPVTDFGAPKLMHARLVDRVLRATLVRRNVYATGVHLASTVSEVEIIELPRISGESNWTLVKRVQLFIEVFHSGIRLSNGVLSWFGLVLISCFAMGVFGVTLYKFMFGHQATYFEVIGISSLVGALGMIFIVFDTLIIKVNELRCGAFFRSRLFCKSSVKQFVRSLICL